MITPQVITSIGRLPGLGRAARWYAAQYPENSVVEIRHGYASGLRWRRHHRYVNGYWIGHYELPLQQALQRELKLGHTFFDLGAHAGFFTLLAAPFVGPSGRCVAFDPAPENCASIREQIRLNPVAPFQVIEAAISDCTGATLFSSNAPGSSLAHLGKRQDGEQPSIVKAMTLDDACSRFGQPDFIKMDIEGAEVRALKGASHTLRHLRPGWVIELHDPECEQEVKMLLRNAGYGFFDLKGDLLNADQILPRHFISRPNPAESA